MLVGIVLVAASMPASTQSDISRRPVSAAVVSAANSASVLTLASALADEEVPAGFVLPPGANAGLEGRGAPSARGLQDRLLTDAAAAFRKRNPDYHLREHDEVLAIVPRMPTMCFAALQRKVGAARLSGDLHRGLDSAFRSFNSAHPTAPPGILGAPMVLPQMDVAFRGGSISDLLNAVSKSVPGFVWAVRETENPYTKRATCQFEYLYQQSRLSTGWQIPPVDR